MPTRRASAGRDREREYQARERESLLSKHGQEIAALKAEHETALDRLRREITAPQQTMRLEGATAERERILAILALADEPIPDVTHAPPASLTAKIGEWALNPRMTVDEARERFHELARAHDLAARAAGLQALAGDEADLDAPVAGGWENNDEARFQAFIKHAGDFATRTASTDRRLPSAEG